MAEYSRLAKGNFTATGTAAIVVLPFTPDYVELWNYTAIKTKANNRVTRAWWDVSLLDGSNNPTMVEEYDNSGVTRFDIIAGTAAAPGISAFQGGLLLQFGPIVKHTANTDFSIAQSGAGGTGPLTTITVSGAGIPDHGLQTGDTVVFGGLNQTATTGMAQINDIPFVITRVSATQFTIFWDTSGSTYAAFNTATSTGNIGFYKKVLFPQLYLPQQTYIAAITLGATTTIKTTQQHGLEVGQEVAFRIPNIWGTTQLNSLPNLTIPGSPVYGYVVSVTDFQTFVVNINSSSYTAFNTNFSGGSVLPSLPGINYAQVVSAGDINTGGVQISSGSALYPAPQWSYNAQNSNSTINGPAIMGSFVNNTSQGFVIGGGAATAVATVTSMITTSDIVYWHAYKHDFASP